MNRRLLLVLVGVLAAQWSIAQAPKWMEKAKRSIFSIVTYDQNDKILNTGNGFFVTEDGIALSDCSLFNNATRAVIVTSDGKQMPIDVILGANSMYDVIKFHVAITEKKVSALQIATTSPAIDSEVYLLPYSTQKDRTFAQGKIKEAAKAGEGYFYYTLSMSLKDKMVSCPVMNAEGQVFGLAQKSSGRDTTTICYAASADFAMSQKIGPFSFNDITLKKIGIPKALPDTEEQALVTLYMASTQATPDEYRKLLDNFVKQYPNSSDGYIRRATAYIYGTSDSDLDKANADMQQAISVATKKDDAYYNISKLIYSYQLSKPEKTYKDWTLDKALEYAQKALTIDPLPVYTQLEGDILFAQQKFAEALVAYEKVNQSNLASPVTFFSAAKTKEFAGGDPKEVVVLLDSCLARYPQPLPTEAAAFVLERAQANMNAEQFRPALADYDTYYDLANGKVNDVFYQLREQAALKSKQYQRALDDIAKAIELNPNEILYRAEQAAVNLRIGRYDEALKITKEIVTKDPKYAEGYRLMGISQIQLKMNAEACTSFAKAKELGDPNVDELISKHCK